MTEPMDATEQFLRAYDDFGDAIFRHCFFRVFSRDEARDLAQETFTRTWKYIAQGHVIENFRAFLYRIANNLIIDGSRKKKTYSLDQLFEERGFDPGYNADERMASLSEAKRLLKDISRLDTLNRDIVIMRYIDDLSPREIGAIIGESENTVSVRIHRAMKELREKLS